MNPIPIQNGLPGSASYALSVQGVVYDLARVVILLFIARPNQLTHSTVRMSTSDQEFILSSFVWQLRVAISTGRRNT